MYDLYIRTSVETEHITLAEQHQLGPNPHQPTALVYRLDGLLHNRPLANVLDFWFDPVAYAKTPKMGSDCDCENCRQKRQPS